MTSSPPVSVGLAAVVDELERALKGSPADETELVWVASRRNGAATGKSRRDRREESMALDVRVLERGRLGIHRCGSLEPSEIALATRHAIAHSRVREPIAGLPHLPADTSAVEPPGALGDPEIRELTPATGRKWLQRRLDGAQGQLDWVEAEVAVVNSRGIRRVAEVTAAQVTVRVDGGRAPRGRPSARARPWEDTARTPGAEHRAWSGGLARCAARSLEALEPEGTAEIARARVAPGSPSPWEGAEQPLPMVLSPEATRGVLDIIRRYAFSALSYADGISFLREHLGVQVFDRAFALRDDGTDPHGLPFPFDLEGTPKQRIELVSEGTPRTPALDQRQAALLGLPPTGHSVGGNDALAQNLFLLPGTTTEEDLLAAADGGLWVGDVSPIECFEPQRLSVRATLRGVRRIRDGKRAEPVQDLLWHGSVLRAAANLLGIGNRPQVGWLHDRGLFGGCSCPPLAFAAVQGLEPIP